MKILVADKFEQSGLDALEALGVDLTNDASLDGDGLTEALRAQDPDVLVVRSTKVTAPSIEAASRLSLIVRAGAGYDTIDVAAASMKGIFVANCPGKNSVAVAELAWGLILACDRRIPDQTADLRAGVWRKKEYAKASGLHGRTLGVVGLGTIGNEVASRGRAFGMNVIAWSRSLTPARAAQLGVAYRGSAVEVARDADVVSINVAATADTNQLVDAAFCAALRPGAYLINTSRGSVVDEDALKAAVRDKGVRVGLDVYASEPAAGGENFADDIVKETGVYGTHHVGASTDQAQEAIAGEAVRIIECYLKTGQVPNCVNHAAKTLATCLLTVRHQNKPGVLAHVFDALGDVGINVEEMENLIYEGEAAACARIQLATLPAAETLTRIRANESILAAEVTELAGTDDRGRGAWK
jgi:D-3-phosphoglycerate dehydrogenase